MYIAHLARVCITERDTKDKIAMRNLNRIAKEIIQREIPEIFKRYSKEF